MESPLFKKRGQRLSLPTVVLLFVSLGLLIALVVIVTQIDSESDPGKTESVAAVCGSVNPNGNVVDLRESAVPGPFNDLTADEIRKLRAFLESDPGIRAPKAGEATLNSSYIHSIDLFLPPKADVLRYLDNSGPLPTRRAHVIVYRYDLTPPRIEEYICNILPSTVKCELFNSTIRRNPIEFSLRSIPDVDKDLINRTVLTEVDKQVGFILRESFGATFTQCSDSSPCFFYFPITIGTGFHGDVTERRLWLQPCHDIIFVSIQLVDFGLMIWQKGSDYTNWTIEGIWYAGRLYSSLEDLATGYNNKSIPTVKMMRLVESENLWTTLYRRGEPMPTKPQRPPTEVEPDGRRYSVKDNKISYLGWTFNFRMSGLFGPAVFDIRFKGERIAYEIALAEISVIYSGTVLQVANFVDSWLFLGFSSKSLVPGADCPDTAVLVNKTFFTNSQDEPVMYDATFCVFEHNNGYPLRRHLTYETFYAGMLDSALILRSGLTLGNYDYIVDFVFHQNGVLETRLMSTGYIIASPFTPQLTPYGFQIQDLILGNLHHHLSHFKVDIDLCGTANRYQTLDITKDEGKMALFPSTTQPTTKVTPTLKRTEQEALFKYNFDTPKYHVAVCNSSTTKEGVPRGYRIELTGMSKLMLPENQGNEPTISWARHQLVATKHKDEEYTSSSPYAAFDGANPVVNFSSFYEDNENIVDEDIVFWIACGLHHIPHTEDLPVTPTVGNHVGFVLLPYNFFPECPSMGSRDAIYIEHVDPKNPAKGVKVNRYGNTRDQCQIQKPTLEEDLANNPDQVLQTRDML